jgi:AcrR family transcriptional regulator
MALVLPIIVLHNRVVTVASEMKIADLEHASGVTRSTIHHYLNLGLLPAPRIEGPKLHLFGPTHVARLKEIRRLRDGGWALARIRERFTRSTLETRPPEAEPGPHLGGMRQRIAARATVLFAERGYEGVRLADLARELGIGKATLYRHFPNKEALFVDCVERVRFTLIPKEARETNERRTSLDDQVQHRAAAVLANFTAFRTLSNLLSSVAEGRDAKLAAKARAELHGMVTNAVPLIERMIRAKLVRSVDPELLAYMLWFALMGAGERMLREPKLSQADVLETYLGFIAHGTRSS